MKKIVILSGAGMSAESGIATFRDAGGLWEGHDVMQVASPEGWAANRDLVLDFYNQRRRQLHTVEPNAGHKALARLETDFDVEIITQNIDDLHERAGSTKIIHLHGELLKARSTTSGRIYEWPGDIVNGDVCDNGSQLRPHIVWFGEAVPAMEQAVNAIFDADYCIIIGTSMQVYPAAGLVGYAPNHCKVYYIDPHPNVNHELALRNTLTVLQKSATEGVPDLVKELLADGHS